MIRLLLADDAALWRATLRILLGRDRDIEIVGEARDGLEAVELAARLVPDVVLLDIRMPRMDGLQAAEAIVAGDLLTRVVMLSSLDDETIVQHAIRIGAKGYLTKGMPPDALLAAVHAVFDGETDFASMHAPNKRWPNSSSNSAPPTGGSP